MPFDAYPTGADVEALLRSASYWPTDALKQDFARLQADIGAAAASEEWERLTGWAPFLAGDIATERTYYDGVDSRGRLDFMGGAVNIESVAREGQNAMPVSAYRAYPENAVSRGQAVTALDFGRHGYYSSGWGSGAYGEIIVLARWGCVDKMPADAWQAIQQKAALIALTQIENLQSIASISFDGFSKSYDVVGIVTQKDLVGIWGKDFEKLASRWTRVVL